LFFFSKQDAMMCWDNRGTHLVGVTKLNTQ